MNLSKIAGLFLLLAASTTAYGLDSQQILISSSVDQFTISKSNGKYTLNNHEVSIAPLKPFLQFFSTAVEGECPKLAPKASAKITVTSASGSATREFFVKEAIIRDGKQCSSIEGAGLYSLPIHRSWFDGPREDKIELGTNFTLRLKDGTQIEFQRSSPQSKNWRNVDPAFFVDWNFFEEFRSHLEKFSLDSRFLVDAIKTDNASFELIVGKIKYPFYLVANGMWAFKAPGTRWLVYSKSWSSFDDMRSALWKDGRWQLFTKVADKNQDLEVRAEALATLHNEWSVALKYLLHKIMLDPSDNDRIKELAVEIMRNHPTDDNMVVLAKALSATQNRSVQSRIAKALRIRHPRGPDIGATDDEDEAGKAIKEWDSLSRSFKE